MKIKDLVHALSQYPSNLEVFIDANGQNDPGEEVIITGIEPRKDAMGFLLSLSLLNDLREN